MQIRRKPHWLQKKAAEILAAKPFTPLPVLG